MVLLSILSSGLQYQVWLSAFMILEDMNSGPPQLFPYLNPGTAKASTPLFKSYF